MFPILFKKKNTTLFKRKITVFSVCVNLSLRVGVQSQPVLAGSLHLPRVPGELNSSRQASLPAGISPCSTVGFTGDRERKPPGLTKQRAFLNVLCIFKKNPYLL